MENKANKKQIKTFNGIVVSNKMEKTLVVRVDRIRINKKYHKRFVISRKFKVHNPLNKYQIGDKVKFVACRPFSKDKKWRVL